MDQITFVINYNPALATPRFLAETLLEVEGVDDVREAIA